jgi:hypothetical protein
LSVVIAVGTMNGMAYILPDVSAPLTDFAEQVSGMVYHLGLVVPFLLKPDISAGLAIPI